jgi:formate/nitrite transporter
MADVFGFDAFSPKEVAQRVEDVGVVKARLPLLSMTVLGILAGGFIGLGALFATLMSSDGSLSFAVARLLSGIAFSLGLILVVVAGAELFTGNNLLVIAWVAGRISGAELMRNSAIVYLANFAGAFGLVVIVVLSRHWQLGDGAVGKAAVSIAAAKASLPFWPALFKGVLCNVLVCLAVWLAMAGRNVVDKIVAIVFPITAFVAAGFEHCIANMYFIPLGILLRSRIPPDGIAHLDALGWHGFASNLLPVTIGNVVGGAVMVGLIYSIVYRRGARASG